MKPRDFKYFFKQGASGIMSNWLMSLASVSIVIACLAIFGIFIILGFNLNYVSKQIEQQCQINVFVPREASEKEYLETGEKLKELDGVKSVKFYTKEERYADYKERNYSGDSEAIAAFDKDNPLRDSCVLTLSDPSMAQKVIKAAQKVEGVETVSNNLDLINKIISITHTVRNISIWFLVILVVIAVFIISNTIKIGMFARRKEINIMKFVGATNWFIRWPFIIEGMILGFIGALFASTLAILAYESIYPSVAGFMQGIKIMTVSDVYNYVVWGFIGLGTLIGMVGSYTSIRKYLHV